MDVLRILHLYLGFCASFDPCELQEHIALAVLLEIDHPMAFLERVNHKILDPDFHLNYLFFLCDDIDLPLILPIVVDTPRLNMLPSETVFEVLPSLL